MINRTITFLGLAGFLAIACSSAPKAEPPSTTPLETSAVATSPGPQNSDNIKMHLRDHQKYPATKAELVAECNGLADFSAEDKAWFANALPDRTYTNADDVITTLGL